MSDTNATPALYVVLWKFDSGDGRFPTLDGHRVYGPVRWASAEPSDLRIRFSTGQPRPCRTRCLGPYIAVSDGKQWVVEPGFPGAGERFDGVSFQPRPPLDATVHDLVPVVAALDRDWPSRPAAAG